MKRILMVLFALVLLLYACACNAEQGSWHDDKDVSFFGQKATSVPSVKPTIKPTLAPTLAPKPSPTPARETVTDVQMTLTFAFGERSGKYTGEVVNGLPDGEGIFFTANTDGENYSYDGGWAAGHFYGEGVSRWQNDFSRGGWHENDYLNGEGWEAWFDVVQYRGGYQKNEYSGQGTLYNWNGEAIYNGAFSNGRIQESAENRSARVGAFKDQSVEFPVAELYANCKSEISVRAKVTGKIFYVDSYPEEDPSACSIYLYEQSIEDFEHIVYVYYVLSEGEALPAKDQTVTVWGTTEYLYTYTTKDNKTLTVPFIRAWSVE